MSAAPRAAPTSSKSRRCKKVADYDATIDAAGFARGEKVWFREMTGIKPLTIAEVVSPSFHRSGAKGVSGLNAADMLAAPPSISRRMCGASTSGDLSKSFQLAGTAIEAVRDVSFSVRRGEFVALAGAVRLRQEHRSST